MIKYINGFRLTRVYTVRETRMLVTLAAPGALRAEASSGLENRAMRIRGQGWAVVLLSGGLFVPVVYGQGAQAPAADSVGRGPSGAIQQRVQPPARIMSFVADQASIKAGESVLLTWSTENPNGVTIDPAPGR